MISSRCCTRRGMDPRAKREDDGWKIKRRRSPIGSGASPFLLLSPRALICPRPEFPLHRHPRPCGGDPKSTPDPPRAGSACRVMGVVSQTCRLLGGAPFSFVCSGARLSSLREDFWYRLGMINHPARPSRWPRARRPARTASRSWFHGATRVPFRRLCETMICKVCVKGKKRG